MSDALSQATKDQEIEKLYHAYIESIIQWYKKKTKKNYANIERSAINYDTVGGRYSFNSKLQGLHTALKEQMEKLVSDDKHEWAKLLAHVHKNAIHLLKDLKIYSPFVGQDMLLVKYGDGFLINTEGLEKMVAKAIHKKGWRTYDCDTFALFLPKMPITTEVHWVDSGIAGVTGPREIPKKKRATRKK